MRVLSFDIEEWFHLLDHQRPDQRPSGKTLRLDSNKTLIAFCR